MAYGPGWLTKLRRNTLATQECGSQLSALLFRTKNNNKKHLHSAYFII